MDKIEGILGQTAIYCFQLIVIVGCLGSVYWVVRYLIKGVM